MGGRQGLIGTIDNPVATFYSPLTRSWEFLAGSLLAWTIICAKRSSEGSLLVWRRKFGGGWFEAWPDALALTGSLLLVGGLWSIHKDSGFPGLQALIPVAGTVLVIAAGPSTRINRTVLSSRWLVSVGLISYPLYLWHWPLLAFARILEGQVPGVAVRVAAIGASVVLAWLTWRLVERPIRFGPWASAKTAALALVMMVCGYAGYQTVELDGFAGRPHVKEFMAINSQFTGPLWKYTKNQRCLTRYRFNESESYDWWFCIANQDAPPSVLVLGSSYANHLYPGLVHHAQLGRNSILSIGTCPVDLDPVIDMPGWTGNHPCSGERAQRQTRFIDQIVASSGTVRYAIIDGLNPEQTPARVEAVRERIDFLEKHKVRVIVYMPHLRHTAGDLKGCFARPMKAPTSDCLPGVNAREELDRSFRPLIDELSKSHPNVMFFDQNELICLQARCSFVLDGMPVFRDQHSHYSEYASSALAEMFASWANRNAPDIVDAIGR